MLSRSIVRLSLRSVLALGPLVGLATGFTQGLTEGLAQAAAPAAPAKVKGKPVVTASGLKYYVLTPGKGAVAKAGDTVKVHYTGTLLNGKQFDSSRGKDPFPVTIGKGMVIKGWDNGLPGMRVGGKRKLTIPWQDAYGEKGSPPSIPPKAALKFDVELLEIMTADDAGAKDAGPTPKAAAKDAGAKK